MIYLSGVVYPAIMRYRCGGLMLTPEMGNVPCLDRVVWAADNGCYTAGDRFSSDAGYVSYVSGKASKLPLCHCT